MIWLRRIEEWKALLVDDEGRRMPDVRGFESRERRSMSCHNVELFDLPRNAKERRGRQKMPSRRASVRVMCLDRMASDRGKFLSITISRLTRVDYVCMVASLDQSRQHQLRGSEE